HGDIAASEGKVIVGDVAVEDDGVDAAAAIERVVVGVAREFVIFTVTHAASRAVKQDEIFDIGCQRVAAERGANGIGALTHTLGHDVSSIVDDIGVVAGAARHGVGTAATVDQVVAGIARERVVLGATDQV